MDPEDGMVDNPEEYVEPLVTGRRSRREVGPQRFPSVATVPSLQDIGSNPEFLSTPALDYHSTLPQQFSHHQSFVPPYGGDDSGVTITIDPIDQIQLEADSSRGKAKVSSKEIVEEDETAVEYEPENKPKAGPSKESLFDPSEEIQSSTESSPYTSPMGEGAKQRYRNSYCPLYIAAAMQNESFFNDLLERMESEHLMIKDNTGNTALFYAVASGNVKIARLMVDRNTNLPNIRGAKEVTPLYIAALLGHRDMAWYLVGVTDLESLEDNDYIGLLFASIESKLYDVALLIVQLRGSVARARNEKDETALHVLVREGSQQVFWRQRRISLFLDRLTGIEEFKSFIYSLPPLHNSQ